MSPSSLSVKMVENNLLSQSDVPKMVLKIKNFKHKNQLQSKNVGEEILNWSCGEANKCFTEMKVSISQLINPKCSLLFFTEHNHFGS